MSEVEQEARKDLAQRLRNLEDAEKEDSAARAKLTEAQEAAEHAAQKLRNRREQFDDSLDLYRAATSIPLDLSMIEESEPTQGESRAQE